MKPCLFTTDLGLVAQEKIISTDFLLLSLSLKQIFMVELTQVLLLPLPSVFTILINVGWVYSITAPRSLCSKPLFISLRFSFLTSSSFSTFTGVSTTYLPWLFFFKYQRILEEGKTASMTFAGFSLWKFTNCCN